MNWRFPPSFPPQRGISPITIPDIVSSAPLTCGSRELGFIGTSIQKTLDSLIPGWDNSVTISLILERESLAAMVVVIVIALFLSLLRFSLRWYGEKHLLACSIRMRHRLRDAYQAFLNTAS